MLLAPQATPEVEVHDPVLAHAGVRLWIKRLDQVHPLISGNKWYKLKYNLIQAHAQGVDTLLSFGGAYSNHIHALAAAGSAYGLKTIAVIRGEPNLPLNPTLQFAVDHGMQLHYINRKSYCDKKSASVLKNLVDRFGEFYLVPEGGTNILAVKGCAEIIGEIKQDFDLLACACGTGGTLAGLISGLQGERSILGFAVLKGASFLNEDVRDFLVQNHCYKLTNWQINLDYHFGGYAKYDEELLSFIRHFEQQHNIPLEQVYTGKLIYGLWDLVKIGRFEAGTRIMVLHSGGLQGRLPVLDASTN